MSDNYNNQISKLSEVTRVSPNKSVRTHKIEAITIHHTACVMTVEQLLAGFAQRSRSASSNYVVDSEGRIGCAVPEDYRSWCSGPRTPGKPSGSENDNRAITIEVSNDKRGDPWTVSDKALEATINLCVDICQRNEIEKLEFTGDKYGSLTWHRMFAWTGCPGPYLMEKTPYIVEEVNKRLCAEKPVEPEEPVIPDTDGVIEFALGDKVKLVEGATYIDGKQIAPFVFKKTLYVRKVEKNEITISIFETGAVTGIVDEKNLVLVEKEEPSKPVEPKPERKVPFVFDVEEVPVEVHVDPYAESDVKTEITRKGSFTVVEMQNGWGLLKGYAQMRNGWILIDPENQKPRPEIEKIKLEGKSQVSTKAMIRYLRRMNPNADKKIFNMIKWYNIEGKIEGIRGDIAFAMSLLETGNFTFENTPVRIEQNNFCGMGVTNECEPGNWFATPRKGIRAHIQHMVAYATDRGTKRKCIDPRFKYVNRGSAPYLDWLGSHENPTGCGWGTVYNYGDIVRRVLEILIKEEKGE